MNDVKWIKIVTDIFDDEKMFAIETLPDGPQIELVWFKLLCLAGRCNSNGMLIITDKIAYTDEMLAKVFRMEIGVVKRSLEVFEGLDMIEVVENAYMISNWSKYQNQDALEKIRQNNKERQARFREKQKLKALEDQSNVTSAKNNVTDNVSDNVNLLSNSYSFISNSNKDNLLYILNNNKYKDSKYILDNQYLLDAIISWMEYKDERIPKKENHYSSQRGMGMWLTEVINHDKDEGTEMVVAYIQNSMANNWKGVIWDARVKPVKLRKPEVQKKPEPPKEEEFDLERWEKENGFV